VKAKRHFDEQMRQALRQSKGLRIRAGSGDHRFIGIWHVVVKERLFVRSWSVREKGWYRTLLQEPRGMIEVGKREIVVRAKRIRDAKLRDAIDRAYLEKYDTPGAVKYAKDLGSMTSRATTLELVPKSGKTVQGRHSKVKG
jgi:hypothetical protein